MFLPKNRRSSHNIQNIFMHQKLKTYTIYVLYCMMCYILYNNIIMMPGIQPLHVSSHVLIFISVHQLHNYYIPWPNKLYLKYKQEKTFHKKPQERIAVGHECVCLTHQCCLLWAFADTTSVTLKNQYDKFMRGDKKKYGIIIIIICHSKYQKKTHTTNVCKWHIAEHICIFNKTNTNTNDENTNRFTNFMFSKYLIHSV